MIHLLLTLPDCSVIVLKDIFSVLEENWLDLLSLELSEKTQLSLRQYFIFFCPDAYGAWQSCYFFLKRFCTAIWIKENALRSKMSGIYHFYEVACMITSVSNDVYIHSALKIT